MRETTVGNGNVPGSFRDPSGFVFFEEGSVYRQVNTVYKEHYDHLIDSGLYGALVDSGLLVRHDEVDTSYARTDDAYRVLKPELVPFLSYPYEWCFSQLKDAALATLEVQKTALNHGMILKDSSAYNIQFVEARPVLIDSLSFEKYREGQSWVAYRQFCQHFVAPLVLMSYVDVRLSQLLRIYIDGVPLDLASLLLPSRTWLRLPLLSHIHLHAKTQRHFADKTVNVGEREISRLALLGLVENLESIVRKLEWQPQGTEWVDYYEQTNYSSDALAHKKQLLGEFLAEIDPGTVWDLGANTGLFSRIAADRGIQTISFDIDPASVEKNYLECREGETNILPLVLDLTNPSPGIGWANRERMSLVERGPTDAVLALALIHHLAISNNLPLGHIADFFRKICNSLIIEFVPKGDSQVQRLLSSREDIFDGYTQQAFEREFESRFSIVRCVNIEGSERNLYLMRKR